MVMTGGPGRYRTDYFCHAMEALCLSCNYSCWISASGVVMYGALYWTQMDLGCWVTDAVKNTKF